jgi:hypothetical protein
MAAVSPKRNDLEAGSERDHCVVGNVLMDYCISPDLYVVADTDLAKQLRPGAHENIVPHLGHAAVRAIACLPYRDAMHQRAVRPHNGLARNNDPAKVSDYEPGTNFCRAGQLDAPKALHQEISEAI